MRALFLLRARKGHKNIGHSRRVEKPGVESGATMQRKSMAKDSSGKVGKNDNEFMHAATAYMLHTHIHELRPQFPI